MEEPGSPRPLGWTIRRAELIDVPAVARLLGAPIPAEWPGRAELSDQTLTSATRLVLTHVALELGEFWVAVERGNRVRAAVVLLPPGRKGGEMMDVAVRLELGLLPRNLPQPATMAGVPEQYWLLLPAAAPDDDQVLRDLIDAAMPAIDADGRAVLCLQSGPAPELLFELGFQALPAPVRHGSASLRLGLDSPIDARTAPSGSTPAPV
ncbi:MAG TPA: hypothetical protein VLL08_23865 [Kineosporiaceae bacterium]|nr:hypothetical protein [Kineosporiaceae bacterium]